MTDDGSQMTDVIKQKAEDRCQNISSIKYRL